MKVHYRSNPLHPDYVDTVYVHRLNEMGNYIVDKYELNSDSGENVEFINGEAQQNYYVAGGAQR